MATRVAKAPPGCGQIRYLSSTRTLPSQTESPRFAFSVAASYIAKDHPYDPSTHVFHFNPYNRVQQHKKAGNKASRPDSGQDAFFVSRVGDSSRGDVALGVADGVGGWMDSGVDPADFSHAFCDYMAAEAYGNTGNRQKQLTARSLMQKGYDAVCHDGSIRAGGSTAVVAMLDSLHGKLEVANLGDSGFVLLRPYKVHYRSEPQIHAFNTPYQLSLIPPSVMMRMAAFGGAQLSDMPSDADVSRCQLQHGDVLVFASDGLWDNLFDQDVLRIVTGTMTRLGAWENGSTGSRGSVADLTPFTQLEGLDGNGKPKSVTLQSLLATEIVAAAKAASVNTRLDGPFAKEVKKYYPHERWSGGKVDDICVIVAVVSEFENKDIHVKAKL